jgi:uroporphyrinogen-III synthase
VRVVSGPLDGIVVGVTERRFAREFGVLLERLGARVYVVPLIEEVLPEDRRDLHAFIERIVRRETDFVVFTTGVGVNFVTAEAAALGIRSEYVDALRRLRIVARGSKTVAALSREGIPIEFVAGEATTAGIIEVFEGLDISAQRILVQLYGASNPRLISALEAQGANVFAVQAYTYHEVSDVHTIERFIDRLLAQQIHLLSFTSAPQVRVLFDHAHRLGKVDALINALGADVVVAAIGSVTLDALAERGVRARIVPDVPKMAPMANAIAAFYTAVAS